MTYQSTPVTDLSNLLAAPVLASIDAEAQAARHFYHFIETFGFTAAGGDGTRELAYFSFTFTYMANGKATPLTVSIPVLSLVPLPLLSMAKATFDYTVQVVDVRSDPEDARRPAVRAMFAEPSSSGTPPPGAMTVSMSVKTSDMPAGIARLLNVSSDAIQTES